MTEQEMIREMLKMQRVLDKAICEQHGTECKENQCRMALLDEVGEFTHELKGSISDEGWCWWKINGKPIDYEKVLEEFVDMVHFALNLHYHWLDWVIMDDDEWEYTPKNLNEDFKTSSLAIQLCSMVTEYVLILEKLFYIGEQMGFTVEQVHEAYKKKNLVNFERLANGY